jgi:hypothetical protein
MDAQLIVDQLREWANRLERGESYLGLTAGMKDVADDLERKIAAAEKEQENTIVVLSDGETFDTEAYLIDLTPEEMARVKDDEKVYDVVGGFGELLRRTRF